MHGNDWEKKGDSGGQGHNGNKGEAKEYKGGRCPPFLGNVH